MLVNVVSSGTELVMANGVLEANDVHRGHVVKIQRRILAVWPLYNFSIIFKKNNWKKKEIDK